MKPEKIRNLSFLFFSIAIGIASAFGALVFRSLIELFQRFFWYSGTGFQDQLTHSPWWMILLIPAAGGLVAGPIITFWIPEAKGTGVPEVIVSVTGRESAIRHRVTYLKALLTSLLIASGASVGREGPIVQIGASAGSSLAQLFRLSPELRRVCLAAGAAAGIAATFNAPIAGTFFAVEVILMDIEIAYISHIMISAITASLLSRIFWGDFPAFLSETFAVTHYWELLVYFGLGLAAGLIAIVFVCMIYGTDSLFDALPIPDWIKPAIGGLILGALALKLPQIMGIGYETVLQTLKSSLPLQMAAILLIAKIFATSMCLGSGMSGGIFAPSLVTGATLGTVIALSVSRLFPEVSLEPAHYALAGMGAVVAGTTLAPITAVLTIFELSYNYHSILPLMLSCITSAMIVRLVFGYSAYEMKLLKKGINIVRGHDVVVLRNLRVRDFMTPEIETLTNTAPLTAVVDKAIHSLYPHFVVLNQKNELAGVLSLRDLKGSLSRVEELKGIVIAADLMTRDVITIKPENNLETALHLFETRSISFLPVTDHTNPKRVIGILKKDDLLQAYKERVLKDRILSSSLQ